MNPQELAAMAEEAIRRRKRLKLSIPRRTRLPPDFPPGEILSETPEFSTRSYKPEKILRYLRDNSLITRNF
jgi:hypothetical protein